MSRGHNASTFKEHLCRCDICRRAFNDQRNDARQRRAARFAADPNLRPHGSYITYREWGCRCQPCRDDNAAVERERRSA